MKFKNANIAGIAVAAVLVLGVVGTGVYFTSIKESERTACVVTSTDRTKNSDGKSDMRVYTENCGTLAVGDNLFKGVWNSADLFGKIQDGKTYDFSTTGFRFISVFPTIFEVTEVK